MGQVQSDEGSQAADPRSHGSDQSVKSDAKPVAPPSSSSSSSSSSSLESLIAEAEAYGEEGEESLDAKAQKALDCPCIAHLRSGPCGNQFSDAFLCFLKSNAEEKGSNCVKPFIALQECIKANPNAFSEDVLEEDEVEKEDVTTQDYKIYPPKWSKESSSPKPKL